MSKFIRSYEEINQRIQSGNAVVMTAEEFKEMSEEQGVTETSRKVDIVTTATFSPMCSSGAFINFGHSDPPIKMSKVRLNGVSAYAGLAAVDAYIGATELADKGEKLYGGAHVIEDLVLGKKIKLEALGYKTDCYPKEQVETYVDKNALNECILFNPRNAYQNYAAATNSTDRTLNTYMGTLLPNLGNITYCTTGELSPLLNDPKLRTIGIGTKIFFGGATGYVAWNGTQYDPNGPHSEKGTPIGPARTLSLVGNLKAMSPDFIKAAVFHKYGVSLFIGIGIPIPVLDEEMGMFLAVRDRDIKTHLIDYGIPKRSRSSLKTVNYEELKSGAVWLSNRKIPSSPLSSIYKARQVARILKEQIIKGDFLLHHPVDALPDNSTVKPLEEKGYLASERKSIETHAAQRITPSEIKDTRATPVNGRVSVNYEECVHCGACAGVCLTGALEMDKTSWKLLSDLSKCTACGLCASSCPLGIIYVETKGRCTDNEQ